jgi:hypothetical protein
MPVKDLYYQKYLKYKNKYLDLQSQMGGTEPPLLIPPVPVPLPLKTSKYVELSEDLQKLILENVDGKLEMFNIASKEIMKTIIPISLKKKLKLDESIKRENMFILNPDVSVYHPVYLTNFEIFELAKIFVENIDRIKTPSIKYMQILPVTTLAKISDVNIKPLFNDNDSKPLVFNLEKLKTCILFLHKVSTELLLQFGITTHPNNDVIYFELLFVFFCILFKNKQLQQLQTPLEIFLSYIDIVNNTNIFISIIFGLKMNIIKKISFYHILLDDSNVKILAAALQANTTLITFDFDSSAFSPIGVKALADALTNNKETKITTLYLHYNSLKDDGVKALANALETNETITTLNLIGNEIGPEGVKALADALTKNKRTKIATLNLGYNKIKTRGVLELTPVLKKNETITSLYLNNNEIENVGASLLAKVLETNKTMRILDLGNNLIGNDGANVLADAFETNETIRLIVLSNNSIDDNVYQQVLIRLKRPY